jgi:hypothetical protein
MLDTTVESVNSALKRGRASMQRRRAPAAGREPAPAANSPMPPMPFEYEGRDIVARFCAGIFGGGRRFDLVRTRVNGQRAFGAYLRSPNGISPRGRSLRAHAQRRQDLRNDSLRKQRDPVVRPPAIACESIARLRNLPRIWNILNQ